MVKQERWGPDRKYPRDWPEYNEQLVRRGEFFLELGWVRSWNEELEEMNEGKVGRPYEFPESLIKVQALWHQLVDFRKIKGITRRLVAFGQLPDYNDYSTICRRMGDLETTLELPKEGNITAASDRTGFQLIEGGEYLREKYGKKNRLWVKVDIVAEPKTKRLLAFDVSLVDSSEPDVAQTMLEELLEKGVDIGKFLGDGGLDKKALFEFLDKHGIEPGIKLPKNAVLGDCEPRNKEVEVFKRRGYKRWAKKKGYGMRWPATEGVFSAVKRVFGENIKAKSIKHILNDARIRLWAYQAMSDYGKNAQIC